MLGRRFEILPADWQRSLMTQMVNVSAIIPVYNGEATISRAIDSVFEQEFDEPIEVVVANDGSTDSTARILESYRHRISIVTLPHRVGVIAARNAAISIARGKYLALLDADDTWLPHKIASQVPALDRNPGAVLAYSEHVPVFADGEVWFATSFTPRFAHPPSLEEMLATLWPFVHSSVVFRRSAYLGSETFIQRAAGNLRAGLGEDYIVLLARERGEFIYFREPLVRIQRVLGYETLTKWQPDVYLALVRDRYGRRAKGLISEQRSIAAAVLAHKAAMELEKRQIALCIRSLAKIMRYDPLYFLRPRVLLTATRRMLRKTKSNPSNISSDVVAVDTEAEPKGQPNDAGHRSADVRRSGGIPR